MSIIASSTQNCQHFCKCKKQCAYARRRDGTGFWLPVCDCKDCPFTRTYRLNRKRKILKDLDTSGISCGMITVRYGNFLSYQMRRVPLERAVTRELKKLKWDGTWYSGREFQGHVNVHYSVYTTSADGVVIFYNVMKRLAPKYLPLTISDEQVVLSEKRDDVLGAWDYASKFNWADPESFVIPSWLGSQQRWRNGSIPWFQSKVAQVYHIYDIKEEEPFSEASPVVEEQTQDGESQTIIVFPIKNLPSCGKIIVDPILLQEQATMTAEERENLIYQAILVIRRWTAKHRRENLNCPSGAEYTEIWAAAVIACADDIKQPRKPGRPKKTKDKVDNGDHSIRYVDFPPPPRAG